MTYDSNSYHEQDGYYARNDPEHRKASFWHGRAAGDLGLRGHVVPSRFESVLQGRVPKTDIRLGRIVEGERRHRPGWDITFSAPKSVSLETLVMEDGMVVAGFRHLTSRDLDPQLHTHCVLANMQALLMRAMMSTRPGSSHEVVDTGATETGVRNGRRGRSEDRRHDPECKGHGRASRDELGSEVRAEPRGLRHG